jgi:hypothetical protein
MLGGGDGVGFVGGERCDGRSEIKNAGLGTGVFGGRQYKNLPIVVLCAVEREFAGHRGG